MRSFSWSGSRPALPAIPAPASLISWCMSFLLSATCSRVSCISTVADYLSSAATPPPPPPPPFPLFLDCLLPLKVWVCDNFISTQSLCTYVHYQVSISCNIPSHTCSHSQQSLVIPDNIKDGSFSLLAGCYKSNQRAWHQHLVALFLNSFLPITDPTSLTTWG